ncbi:TraR/DksA family transcriptional regulator [Pseudorhodobacter turbinis]
MNLASMEVAMKGQDIRRRELETRRDVLTARLGTIEDELDSHQSKDWDDLATERESDEVLEGLGLSSQQELRMIEAALARMDAGEYGACTKCGADISEERLDVVPFTPFCRDCAA